MLITIYSRKSAMKVLLVIALLLPYGALQAAEKNLNLAQAVQRALAGNPSLQVFSYRFEALNANANAAELRPAFELGFDVENFAGSGGLNGFGQAELTVSLSSTIELGDKRGARMQVETRRQSHLNARQQVAALELLGEVTRRFVDVLAAQERILLARQGNALAQEALIQVKKRAAAAAAPDAEVKRALAAASQTHLTVLSEESRISYLKVALASLWGEKTVDFAAVEGDLYRFSPSVTFDELYQNIAQNPAVQIFASESRLREAQIRQARTQASTDIRWSVGVRQFQEMDETALVAGFSLPLFSNSRNKSKVRAATAALNATAVEKELTLLTLHTQLFQAFNSRQQAIHTADDLRKDIIPALEDALAATKKAYQRGRYSYINYVSARVELLRARRSQIDAATAALRYGADIEQLTGQALSIPASQKNTGL